MSDTHQFPNPEQALLLTSASDLSRAAKAWRRCEVLAVDTEFVRERTFYAALGLVQISDGQTIWLVDPITIDDLQPVSDMLADSTITKVLHSPSEDFDVLRQSLGVVPSPVFDTQLAAALLGQDLQLAYTGLIEWLFDETVDKDQTRSDWTRRPLSRDQLRYAALDVAHLTQAYHELSRRLQNKGRLAWAREDNQRSVHEASEDIAPDQLYLKVKGAGKLRGRALALLQSLARWRDQQARQRNLPRSFILNDHTLIDLAQRKPSSRHELEQVDNMHPRAAERYAATLLQMVADSEGQTPPPALERLDRQQHQILKKLQSSIRAAAKDLGVHSALLASRRELQSQLLSDDSSLPAKWQGWREPVLADTVNQLEQAS